ncbi:MAG: Gfo/Idh/MocA family oxidoreductase [Sphingomonas sp.]
MADINTVLDVGVVGAGAIAHNIHLPVLANIPGARIAWVADRDTARASKLAKANGVQARAIDGPLVADAVVLAIPLVGRDAWLRRFSAENIAVLVEKPFASTAEDHRVWQAMFPVHQIGVGYQRRFHSTSRFLKQALRDGWFGRLRHIVHREGARTTRAGGHGYFDLPASEGGGITKNLACHGIDLLFHLTDAQAFRILGSHVESDAGSDRRLAAEIALTTPSGEVTIDMIVSELDRQPSGVRFEFERATLSISTAPSSIIDLGSADSTEVTKVDASANGGAATSNQAFYLEWQDFLQGVRSGIPGLTSAASALLTAEAMDALLAEGGAA